jgi:antitoxin component of MazEF toxin-antitoxin module
LTSSAQEVASRRGRRWRMPGRVVTRKTDAKGRVTLTKEFASCVVTVEFHGAEVRIRKAKQARPRKYTLRQLLAGINPENLHPEFDTGPAVGREAL